MNIANIKNVRIPAIRFNNLTIKLYEDRNFEIIEDLLLKFDYEISIDGGESFVIKPVKKVHKVMLYEADAVLYNPFKPSLYVDDHAIDIEMHPEVYLEYRVPLIKMIETLETAINTGFEYMKLDIDENMGILLESDNENIQKKILDYQNIIDNENKYSKKEYENAVNNIINLKQQLNEQNHGKDNFQSNDDDDSVNSIE